MVIFLARITLVNINSQTVQVLGFILLGRMPKARNGTESTPRSGTGTCICCQHPMQIFAWFAVMVSFRRRACLAGDRTEQTPSFMLCGSELSKIMPLELPLSWTKSSQHDWNDRSSLFKPAHGPGIDQVGGAAV